MTLEEYDSLKRGDFFTFKCTNCSKETTVKKARSLKDQSHQKLFLCRNCHLKKTNLERYGVENVAQSETVKEKIKTTCIARYGTDSVLKVKEVQEKAHQSILERYGVSNVFQSEEIKEKIRQTNLEKYGVESPLQSKKILEKRNQNNLEKYGVENPQSLKEFRERMKQTNLEKYGVEFPAQSEEIKAKTELTNLERYGVKSILMSPEFREKSKQTCLERYGVEYFAQTEEVKEKSRQTCLEKYGVGNYSQTEEFHKKKKSKYFYDGLRFDSRWELAFYLFHKNRGSDIIYHPCYFEYEFENKIHRYFPDFQVNGKLIEIKGDHFMKDGEMICPFKGKNGKNMTPLYSAKYKCALDNGVIFLFEKDLKECLDYLNQLNLL